MTVIIADRGDRGHQKELDDLDAKKADETVDPEVEKAVLEPDEPAKEAATEPPPVAEEKPAQRQVPLEALKEEREKRQALERRLAELEYRLSQPAQPEEEPAKIPDVNEDPLAAIEYTARELQEMKRQQQEQAERTRLITAAQMATAEYAKNVPESRDAYSHVLNSPSRSAPVGRGSRMRYPDLSQRLRITTGSSG